MQEIEYGTHGSAFCGIKVSVYFDGKQRGKNFTFFDKATKTYLAGDEREPVRELARKEEARLLKLQAKWKIDQAAAKFGTVDTNGLNLRIHLGIPSTYISAINKITPTGGDNFHFSMRGYNQFNKALPKTYNDFRRMWGVTALSMAERFGYKAIPKVWIAMRPTKEQWLGYLDRIIEFTHSFGHKNYVVDGEGLRNPLHEGKHYITGFDGLTFKVVLIRRIVDDGVLAARISIMEPRGLRPTNSKPKTRAFQLYNYKELEEIWPHAIDAYCKICKVKKTQAMLDAIPNLTQFNRAFELGKIQFSGRLSKQPNPTNRNAYIGNQKPLDQL